MAFVPADIPVSSQNVGFSSTKTRALSGVYVQVDTYDDDGDCIVSVSLLRVIHVLVNLCMYISYMF